MQPKYFKPRPVPFCLPVLKQNASIRSCGDFKVAINTYLIEQKYPLPRIVYIFSHLQGGTKFSKIGLSEAYQQLTDESQQLVTISTHKGLFLYTRLPYGVKSAPAIFQNIMERLLIIPAVACFLDDILVTGATEQQHGGSFTRNI